jgi:UDP-glucose 4-epimerase
MTPNEFEGDFIRALKYITPIVISPVISFGVPSFSITKKTILITGGAGYIGSVAAELLEKKGHKVIIIDDLSEGKRGAISTNSIFYQSNFGDINTLEGIFKEHKIDFVFHFAASANVPDSVVNPLRYYENNVTNTISLLKMMIRFDVKNIIFSSTAAVFGEPVYTPIDEKHILNPVNPYGMSKLVVENILSDFSKAYKLKFIAFRYFCAAGSTIDHGESRDFETHLIPVVLDQILNKRDYVTVFGNNFNTQDGTGVRDFIHVEDIAIAHILAMENFDRVSDKFINLGNGKGYSVLEVIKAAEKYLNKKVSYKIGERRPGDPAVLIASYQNAFHQLGWEPSKTLEDIIKSAYTWRKNPKY